MTPQRLAEIREWHQRRTDESRLAGYPIRLAGTHVGELLAYVDHLEGLLADCEQSGEFQAGAAAERKAICGLIDALCCEDSLGDHPYRTSIETWLAVLKGEIGKRGPVPQDALPPTKLRERVAKLERVLHRVMFKLAAHRHALGEADQTGDNQ